MSGGATIQEGLSLTSQGGGGGSGPVTITIPDLTTAAYLINTDHASAPPWLQLNTDIPGGSRVFVVGSDVAGSPDLYDMWSAANTSAFRWRDKSRNRNVITVNTLVIPVLHVGNPTDGGTGTFEDGIVAGGTFTDVPAGGAAVTLPTGQYVKNTQGFGGQFLIGSNSTTIFVGSSSNTVADIQIVCDTTKRISIRVESLDRMIFDSTGLGFFGTAGVAKATVTGSRTDGTALASLLTALDAMGLVTDSSTA